MKNSTLCVTAGILVLLVMLPVPILAGAEDESGVESCPVTHPNGQGPTGERRSPNHHGNGKLWTVLRSEGLIEFGEGRPGSIGEDGVLGMKFPWWRGEGVRGPLEISGRRLDGEAPPAYGEIPDGYGDSGFQASGIIFPTEGCWEITGAVGDVTLTFVQYVRIVR
ncbi:MAG: hypothetical protein R3288_04975 [Woeseiaceae bacterium]|nr:hypothetical protein [Woeseiaceae bacterium]